MSLGDWIGQHTTGGVMRPNNAKAMPRNNAPQTINMNELMQFANQFMSDPRYKGDASLFMKELVGSGKVSNEMVEYAKNYAMSNPCVQAFNMFSKMFSGIRGMFK